MIRKSVIVPILLLMALLLAMSGCGGKATLDMQKYDSVKRVAVITYTVPDKIDFRDDPKAQKASLTLGDLVKAALESLRSSGTKAATLAHESFTETLNGQGLSFTVMSQSEMLENGDFVSLYKPVAEEAEAESSSKLAAIGSFLKSKAMAGPPKGAAPRNMNQYGLAANWNDGKALMGTTEEKQYIADAVKALRVDAVILMNDPGFSFNCKACVGVGGVMSGAASTGSAFLAAMVDRDGNVILDMQEWFAVSEEEAALVGGVINPLEIDALFKAHGKKAAEVFASKLKDTRSKAGN